MSSQTLIFLCTGNFYRSRIAEAIFNHQALLDCVEWRATSRGLQPKLNQSGLSPLASEFLMNRRIPLSLTAEQPQKLMEDHLANASMVVAIDEEEHRPIISDRFPHWEDRVVYWQIPDIDVTPAEIALPHLEEEVRDLCDLIKDGCAGCGVVGEF